MRMFATNKNRTRSPLRNRRQGFSLIEIVVMASVTSAMLVMVTSWIHQTMKQSSRFRMEHREQLAVSKLSQHFRKHVWLAKTADTSEANSISLTNSDGEQFKYSLNDQQLHFAHRSASGDLQSMERFILPALSKATFSQNGDSTVTMKVETSAVAEPETGEPNSGASRTSLVVKSTLARWLQFSSSTSLGRSAGSGAKAEEVTQ